MEPNISNQRLAEEFRKLRFYVELSRKSVYVLGFYVIAKLANRYLQVYTGWITDWLHDPILALLMLLSGMLTVLVGAQYIRAISIARRQNHPLQGTPPSSDGKLTNSERILPILNNRRVTISTVVNLILGTMLLLISGVLFIAIFDY